MKTEKMHSRTEGADSVRPRAWVAPVIVFIGIILTGVGAFYFFQAGVSRITATGISGSKHGARMLALILFIGVYWLLAIIYLVKKKKNED